MKPYALEARELAIGYRRARRADVRLAQGLNLRLEAGKLVGLLGPNGVGKSTLLRTLAGMHPPLSGRMLLEGDDLRKLRPIELARRLSLVLTDAPRLGLMRGYELAALGRLPHTDWLGKLSERDQRAIDWALAAVSASGLAAALVTELSDGQRQKLMIARALAQEAQIMLLDEPTAFLDLPRRIEVMQMLRRLAVEADLAILVSTHDLDLALRNCDELWLMSEEAMRIGVPEDLALSGAIERTFSSGAFSFDSGIETISSYPSEGRRVSVAAEGNYGYWMRRALERSGYQLGNGASDAEVRYPENGAQSQWQLAMNGKVSVHDSIASVLGALEDGV